MVSIRQEKLLASLVGPSMQTKARPRLSFLWPNGYSRQMVYGRELSTVNAPHTDSWQRATLTLSDAWLQRLHTNKSHEMAHTDKEDNDISRHRRRRRWWWLRLYDHLQPPLRRRRRRWWPWGAPRWMRQLYKKRYWKRRAKAAERRARDAERTRF